MPNCLITKDSNNHKFGYLFFSLDSKVTVELDYASIHVKMMKNTRLIKGVWEQTNSAAWTSLHIALQ